MWLYHIDREIIILQLRLFSYIVVCSYCIQKGSNTISIWDGIHVVSFKCIHILSCFPCHYNKLLNLHNVWENVCSPMDWEKNCWKILLLKVLLQCSAWKIKESSILNHDPGNESFDLDHASPLKSTRCKFHASEEPQNEPFPSIWYQLIAGPNLFPWLGSDILELTLNDSYCILPSFQILYRRLRLFMPWLI